METYKYDIEGMSCQHCIHAITEEVSEIPGVANIKISLDDKTLSLDSPEDVTTKVKAAVDEAGYEVK
ncbi:MAG: cation transporter [Micrococcaceae bacterium]